MDPNLSLSDEEFVGAANVFLARHWQTADARLLGRRGELVRSRYLTALAACGRLTGHWPRQYGGLGWTPRQRWLWEREAARAQAPQPAAHGPDFLGAALITYGSEVQQRQHLPAIAEGSVHWCQAFGEDSAGLDLAQLTTIAVPVDRAASSSTGGVISAGWALTGVKPWVLDVPAGDTRLSGANWIYVLARVSAHPQPEPALSADAKFGVFLLDLASPGITVTPSRMIGEEAGRLDSLRYSVGCVTLDKVQVPPAGLLGPMDSTASLALGIEQAEFAQPGVVARNELLLAQLRDFVQSGELDGGSLWRDDDFRTKLHELEIGMASLQAMEARSLGAESEFVLAANLLIAARNRQISQQLADLQVEALGYFALPYTHLDSLDNEGPIGPEFSQPVLFGMLSNRAREAVLAPRDHLKNIIAKSVLGLSSATLL